MHRIDNLCTYISTTRSMRAYFHLGVQSDSMLAAKYGDFNAINLKNSTTELFFGSNEKTTLNRFVSQGGETTTVDINCRLGMSDHIAFKTYNVVTTSDLSIMPLGTFYVRQARHMLLKSSMIPSFAVKEFQNSDDVQGNQEEIMPVSKKLDFSLLGKNQESQKQDKCDDEEEKRRDEIEKKAAGFNGKDCCVCKATRKTKIKRTTMMMTMTVMGTISTTIKNFSRGRCNCVSRGGAFLFQNYSGRFMSIMQERGNSLNGWKGKAMFLPLIKRQKERKVLITADEITSKI